MTINFSKCLRQVGSTKNMRHKPQGGDILIYDEKVIPPSFSFLCFGDCEDFDGDSDEEDIYQVEWQTDSRVGSRKTLQHRAGGGDVKVAFIKIVIIIMFKF